MFDPEFVTFQPRDGCVDLVNSPIFVHASDFPGIHLAVANLAQDFGRVAGRKNLIRTLHDADGNINSEHAIIVGSLQSPLIQKLEREEKLHVSDIRGRWESFVTAVVDQPFSNCGKALVIAGSDNRGTIFGVYTLSEQIGVSPYDQNHLSIQESNIWQLVLVGRCPSEEKWAYMCKTSQDKTWRA